VLARRRLLRPVEHRRLSLDPGWRSSLAALCVAGPVHRCIHSCRPDIDRRQLRPAVRAPYLLINGFFLVPVIAAAQLNPWISAVVAVPAVLVYLGSSLLIRKVDADPISEIVLRTGLLTIVGIGCVLLSRVQRSRVSTIARLLDERTALLAEMVTIEQREQRDLAETLHDGALQYVLAARQELEAVEEGDPEAAERIDLALAETSRLLRSTMTQLHPAVVDTAGLLPALRDLVETVNARGQLSAELRTRNWEDSLRTPIDELLADHRPGVDHQRGQACPGAYGLDRAGPRGR